MGLLVVGSIALDSVATPFGETADAPGGSAVFFSAAGAILHPVQVVGVVGSDYPLGALKALEARGVDLSGVEQMPGESFRWKAKYSYDLSSRETLDTRLGVFAQFRPKLPPKFRDARYVFLGNIDPELQLGVLDQVKSPALVACDTMNYWIHSKQDLLLELLRHIDILMVNDSEARELSGDWNIYRAAQWILERGPKRTVIKQGEHGALLVDRDTTFKVPAYPLQEVFDPTGAGDAFAGGFMAHLAATGDLGPANLRRAMVYGAALGSFAVEAFGVQGLAGVTQADVYARVCAFKQLVHFDVDPASGDAGGAALLTATPPPACIWTPRTKRSVASPSWCAPRAPRSRSATSERSAGWCASRRGTSARCSCSRPTAWAPRCSSPRAPESTTPWGRTSSTTVSTTSWSTEHGRSHCSTTSPPVGSSPTSPPRS